MRTILLLASNPKGTHRLRLDEEVRRIEEVVERSRGREGFRIVVKWAVTDDDLRRGLLDHEPEIVHFLGHGTGPDGGESTRDLRPAEMSAPGGLAFENPLGYVLTIPADALSRLFELVEDQVRCVVLNACFSAREAESIARHIDYVIGMNKAIGDEAAVKFSVGFYDAVLAGKSYEIAFKYGCSAIDLCGIPEHLTPTLKRKKRRGESTAGFRRSASPGHAASADARVEQWRPGAFGPGRIRRHRRRPFRRSLRRSSSR